MDKQIENNWRSKPTEATTLDEDAEYILYIDENGHNNLKNIINCIDNSKEVDENEKYFNVTAVLMKYDEFLKIASSFSKIKHKYWENGKYNYKGREMIVCFHSEEIRKQKGAFSKNAIDQNLFFDDLNDAMANMKADIYDCFINKYRLYLKYSDHTEEPYCIAIKYILERVTRNIKDKKVMVILESRGKQEDIVVLETIKLLMLKGTFYISSKMFNKISGVYFNPKRTNDNTKTYTGLEIADLCAYPIYKYCKLNKKDKAFELIETKIYGYPYYFGRGLKFVP